MFRDLQSRFECYQILYEQAQRQTNPVVREAMLASFQEFKEIARAQAREECDAAITDQVKRQKEIQQYMLEESAAFQAAGNCPFTKDDIIYAAWLHEKIAIDEAFLSMLRRGEIIVTLNHDNIEDSLILPGETNAATI
jgi:hypothetical protein